MPRNTVQTSVQLYPYHRAGIAIIEKRMKKLGKGNDKGLTSHLVREGLERIFAEYGVTDEDIEKALSK